MWLGPITNLVWFEGDWWSLDPHLRNGMMLDSSAFFAINHNTFTTNDGWTMNAEHSVGVPHDHSMLWVGQICNHVIRIKFLSRTEHMLGIARNKDSTAIHFVKWLIAYCEWFMLLPHTTGNGTTTHMTNNKVGDYREGLVIWKERSWGRNRWMEGYRSKKAGPRTITGNYSFGSK